MTLAFSTQWPKTMPDHLAGKPTFFIEKILECFPDIIIYDWSMEYFDKFKKHLVGEPICSKKHTIRQDSKNRWKAGNDIHSVINNRTPNRFQFAPVIKCKSTQEISIIVSPFTEKEAKYGFEIQDKIVSVLIDSVWQSFENIKKLAINDGFNSVEDFFAWFNKDFKGKIIHWTNLKY